MHRMTHTVKKWTRQPHMALGPWCLIGVGIVIDVDVVVGDRVSLATWDHRARMALRETR